MGLHAQQFLEKILPSLEVDEAGAPKGFLNIHWSKPATNPDGTPRLKNGKPDKFWDGRACSTIDEMVRTINWVKGFGNADIYVCMSSQGKFEEKTSSRGTTYKRAMRFAEDAIALRSIYIDIDVKDVGGYASTGEALKALQSFMGATGMPVPSAVVASGSGGFHVHWSMDRNLTIQEWQRAANALSVAAQRLELKCDTQCTVDSVRILRVPDTLNYKSDPAKTVSLMSLGDRFDYDAICDILSPYIGVLPDRVTAPRLAENDELGANMDVSKVELKIGDVAGNCPFVARVVGTGGADVPQPIWFLTASLATFLEDGRDAFHMMSEKHARYSTAETDAMFTRVQQHQLRKNIGWPSCSKFAGAGVPECQNCPLLAANKSPLNFTIAAADDMPELILPERYVRNAEGVIHIRHVDEDGKIMMIPLWQYPIITAWLSNDPWTFHFVSRTTGGRRITVEVPTEVIFAREGFSKYLGSKGFFCTETQYRGLKEFFVAWLQKLQQSKDSVISASPFGWSVVDGKIEGFAYAGKVWTREGDRPAANPNPVLSYQYTPKGEAKHWRELAQVIYEQKRPSLDAIIAVAFAAPLVRFTGFPGLLLNAYSSESGIGKTTAMKVSQSVWGHPVLAMQGLNDTTNSVLGKMGQIRSLPMYWDELKSEQQTKRFVSIVFDLTGGREKTRMNADTSLRLSGTWQTMLVSASNDSIIDAMSREVGSTTAGLHRLFEYVVPKPAQVTHDVGAVQRLTGRLEDNYGHAGLAYAQFLGANWKRVEDDVAAMQDAVCRDIGVQQEERNWAATIAVLMQGAKYANELGMTKIDLAAMKDFLLSVLAKMRGEVSNSPTDLTNNLSVSAVLAEFFNSTRARNTLITNKIHVGRGKPPKSQITIMSDTTRLGEIMVQIGREDKKVRISSVALGRWMVDRGYSRHALMQRLERDFGIVKVNGKLGGGTDMTCATEYLIELDGNEPTLAAFLDV